MDELEELLRGVPPLVASLQAVREEDSRHSQYVTAMDSLKHIFTVPESVAKTKQWIGEGKLLHAHQVYNSFFNVILNPSCSMMIRGILVLLNVLRYLFPSLPIILVELNAMFSIIRKQK